MGDRPSSDPQPTRQEPPGDDEMEEPRPDIVPEGAPRGAQTIPSPSQTGTITPPISGWGETVEPGSGPESADESTDPRGR